MKKVLCVILSALLLLGTVAVFAACGNKTNPTESTDKATDPATPSDVEKTDVKYVFLDEKMGIESYAIGFRKDDTELAAQVTAAYKALVKNGTYDEIGKKYPDIYDYLNLKPEDFSDDEIAEKGSGDAGFTFKHGFDLDFPPYSYRQDDGTVGGFDVEMAQAVCE